LSRLVRLYPQAWRERYGDEFAALLEERPPTPSDVLDTLRGALDAHLRPSVGHSEPAPLTHRLPGLMALTAGLLWSGLYLNVALRLDPTVEWGPILSIFIFAVLFSLIGDYMAAHGRQIAIAIGLLALSIVLANVVGTGFGVVAFLIAACGPLALAAIRAGIAPRGRWLLLGAVYLPLVVGVSINLLRDFTGIVQIPSDGPVMFALLLPYGFAWILVGVRMTIRGSPTVVDLLPRVPDPEPEVKPA
jgi:hypothetical protein